MLNTEKHKPFGTYNITLMQNIVFNFIKAGWGRGDVRKIASKLWKCFDKGAGIYDVTRWNVNMRFYDEKNVMSQIILFNSKEFDKEEVEIFKERISDGEVFADIGANMGYWGLRMGEAFPNLKILCFEPNPIMHERVQANIECNSWQERIHAIPYAVSDEKGTAKLTIWNPIDYSVGSINKDVLNQKVEDESALEHFVDIKTMPLIDCLKEFKVAKIDALKIVIEGHEPYALLPYLKNTPKSDWPHTILLKKFFIHLWAENPIRYLLDNDYEILLDNRTSFVLGRPLN